jgi:hypothetical protein
MRLGTTRRHGSSPASKKGRRAGGPRIASGSGRCIIAARHDRGAAKGVQRLGGQVVLVLPLALRQAAAVRPRSWDTRTSLAAVPRLT